MEEPAGTISKIFEQREREYMMAPVRVTMRASMDDIEVGDVLLRKSREGETLELPRWMAEELVESKLADTQDESFEVEIFKALAREKMLASPQLSPLAPDFYQRMRRRIATIRAGAEKGKYRREDYLKLRENSYNLVGRRLSKLLSLSSSSSIETIADKITPEEKVFFSTCSAVSAEWKRALLGD